MRPGKLLLPILLITSLSGCVTLPTGPSVLVMPAKGKPFEVFQSEVENCKQVAGGRMGKYYDYYSSEEAQFYYDNAYVQCMISYGNRTPQPVRMYRSPSMPPPGNYAVPPPGTPPPDD
jgi:hypothetical protein